MAAPQPSDVCATNTNEMEMSPVLETDESPVSGDISDPEKKDFPQTGQETAEPLKKPGVFLAPSLVSRRGIAPAADVASVSADEKNSTGGGKEDEDTGDKNRDVAPVTTKARVLPAKPVPAGKFPPLPYTEPSWGGTAPDVAYALEVLKNGTIVDRVPLSHTSYFVVGRLPVCDVTLEHPSISRYHAVIQYRGQPGEPECPGEERGFYIQDLGSTHGTVLNKNRVPPKTYIRLRVGHVLKFGGSTRLFILQGPDFDEEEESELTVTELKERAKKQRAELERRMMGEHSDEEDEKEEGQSNTSQSKQSADSGCSWGMAEEAVPEEDENEENPFSTEFHEDQEAAYLKDPKKALQGFYDREGEELEFEYEDKSHGSWLCRIKLPVDDAMGRQLVAEVTHTGKKKEAAVQCCLEACRMLEARGLLRQEAVSRKRKKKNWEDEDYYDSDDDTFLDRTGTVEKKRQDRMKKAGKLEERPDTYESLVDKLSAVEKELAETQTKLSAGGGDSAVPSNEDPLDAFMSAVRSEAAMGAVERRKLHLHIADLRRDAQRLRRLVDITRPAQMPSLLPSVEPQRTKKNLPLFGAMKGGSKFKLKTGTIGKMPPKRPNLPAELFNMRELPPGGEEEEEEEQQQQQEEEEDEEEEEQQDKKNGDNIPEMRLTVTECNVDAAASEQKTKEPSTSEESKVCQQSGKQSSRGPPGPSSQAESRVEGDSDLTSRKALKKKATGPKRPPLLSKHYPEDDPDYCVWVPPSGQTGDGRTHLNDKYGY